MIEIKSGMSIDDIIKLLMDIDSGTVYKHHIFKERGTIELVFEEVK